MASCAGCLQAIEDQEYLRCYLCLKVYDLLCAKESKDIMTKQSRNAWSCHECRSKRPKTDNTNTPVQNKQEASFISKKISKHDKGDEISFVSVRTKKQNTSSTACLPLSPSFIMEDLVDEIRLFKDEMRAVREEMQALRSKVEDFTSAIKRCDERIDGLASRMDDLERIQCDKVSAYTLSLERSIVDLKMDLNDREQEMLRNDIEIAGIPEVGGEGTVHIVLTVADKLGVTVTDMDIVSAERVGPPRVATSGEMGPRPRPITVRFTRREPRDQLLAAARVRRRVTTEGMDLTVTPRPFYVNERLTRSNRQIFRITKEASVRKGWRYVWTRDGRIYARQQHGSTRHRVRSEDDLIRVFGPDSVGAS